MFGKRCSRCEGKLKSGYSFCPACGISLQSNYERDDYGMLGKDDAMSEEKMSFTDSFMEKMFNSALKVLEKQLKNFNSDIKNSNNSNNSGLHVQFFVNGEKVFADNGQIPQTARIRSTMSKDKIKRFSQLPKHEPQSKVKRFADKIIYELNVPGVASIEDVLINQLESSIEVKALSQDRVYMKNLKVNLPVLRYQLINDNLVIEMQAR